MTSGSLAERLKYAEGSLDVDSEPATEKAALGVVEVKIEQSQAAARMLEALPAPSGMCHSRFRKTVDVLVIHGCCPTSLLT